MRFFGPDSGFYKFIQTLSQILLLNILWLITSLPIVTLGGATIAAHDICMKMLDGEDGHIAREFFSSFRRNFKNGIPYGILFLLCIYVVWLDFSLFQQIEGNPIILLIMGMIAAFVFVLSFLFAFALQARYENSLIHTLKNSVDISVRYFVRTLTLLIVLALEILVIFWNMTTMFVGVLIGPTCVMYTVSSYARYFFGMIEKEPGSVIYPENEEREDCL